MLKAKNETGPADDSAPDKEKRLKEKGKCAALKFTKRLRRDGVYRRKFVLTLAVCWSYVNLGWVVLQIGTALPDLQLLVHIDLETASWLFTSWSLGFVVGSLFCGFLYDKVNRLVVMFVCTFGLGVCSVCLPHGKTFTAMVIIRVISGVFCGGIDTGANTIVPSIWGTEVGPFMQALYLSYTVGSIASPLATEPFMSVAKEVDTTTNSNLRQYNNTEENDKKYRSIGCATCQGNFENPVTTDNFNNYTHDILMVVNNSNFTNTTQPLDNIPSGHDIKENLSIHQAFMMTCGLVLCSAIPYLVMVLTGNFDILATSNSNKNTDVTQEAEPLQEKHDTIIVIETVSQKTEGKRKYFVLACVAGVNLLYSATEDSLGDFLVTFALKYLEWDSSASVSLISLYWVGSCIGGLSGMVLVRFFRPTKLLLFSHLLWITTFLLSLLASLFRIDVMIWIFVPSAGFFMVHIIPAAISWTEENVCHVTGKISSLFMIATGAGIGVNPTFIGYMMEEYTYISFLSILFIESVICFGLYILAYTFRNFRYTPEKSVKKVEIY